MPAKPSKPAAPRKPRRTPLSKLKGQALADYEELQARIAELPNRLGAAGQARLLDVGVHAYVLKIPDVVLQLLEQAEPISVADATARATATGKTWQDTKATLELQLRLIRARALWEHGDTEGAGLELTQITHSPSSRRAELILAAASRVDAEGNLRADWSPTFSLALLRSASAAFTNSLPAALSLVDAMTGAGEQAAAAMVLGQVIAGLSLWPDLDRASLADRIARLDAEQRAPLEAQLAAAGT
jgi:hypothetical protein